MVLRGTEDRCLRSVLLFDWRPKEALLVPIAAWSHALTPFPPGVVHKELAPLVSTGSSVTLSLMFTHWIPVTTIGSQLSPIVHPTVMTLRVDVIRNLLHCSIDSRIKSVTTWTLAGLLCGCTQQQHQQIEDLRGTKIHWTLTHIVMAWASLTHPVLWSVDQFLRWKTHNDRRAILDAWHHESVWHRHWHYTRKSHLIRLVRLSLRDGTIAAHGCSTRACSLMAKPCVKCFTFFSSSSYVWIAN